MKSHQRHKTWYISILHQSLPVWKSIMQLYLVLRAVKYAAVHSRVWLAIVEVWLKCWSMVGMLKWCVIIDRYATIRDEKNGRQVDVCAGGNRARHVYTSMSNKIEIKLAALEGFAFLLKYEGKGWNMMVWSSMEVRVEIWWCGQVWR